VKPNPIRDFGIDKSTVRFLGRDLQRPECILAEPDGTLWVADARGGVVCIRPDGNQRVITQRRSSDFQSADSEASRYLEGTLPNGLAFSRTGDFLISNFGTDCLEVMSRDGKSKVLVDSIDGAPIGKVNFVLRDSRDRVWITVSTRVRNWMHALRTDLSDGYLARYENGTFTIVADGFRFTNEIRFDAKEEFLYVVETTGGCISRLRIDDRGSVAEREIFGIPTANPCWLYRRLAVTTASRSTAMETCGALSCTPDGQAVRSDACRETCASSVDEGRYGKVAVASSVRSSVNLRDRSDTVCSCATARPRALDEKRDLSGDVGSSGPSTFGLSLKGTHIPHGFRGRLRWRAGPDGAMDRSGDESVEGAVMDGEQAQVATTSREQTAPGDPSSSNQMTPSTTMS
jgi:sugar lactone lactonase YvrE